MAVNRITIAGFALLLFLVAYRLSQPATPAALPRPPAEAFGGPIGRRPMPLATQISAVEPAAVVVAATRPIPTVEQTVITPPPELSQPPTLVGQPLPNCSVIFFHHLEKTGGTTLRSILQRHAQLGEFDFVSFVNRFDKLQLQMVLHRLHTLLDQPDGLANLRLAVHG